VGHLLEIGGNAGIVARQVNVVELEVDDMRDAAAQPAGLAGDDRCRRAL